MALPRHQFFAAVCGNGHILTDMLDRPVPPGTGEVPRFCPSCSAPVFTSCTSEGCNAPINGDKESIVLVVGSGLRADWFCQSCHRPYIWARPDQIRDWIENRLRFDDTIDPDAQLELIEALAVLTPCEGSTKAPTGSVQAFSNLLKRLPAIYREVKPYLPTLLEMLKST